MGGIRGGEKIQDDNKSNEAFAFWQVVNSPSDAKIVYSMNLSLALLCIRNQ